MKRILTVLSLSFAICLQAIAADYLITRLTTPKIWVGNSPFKKGDRISDRDFANIKWESNAQKMEVKNLSTGRLHMLSKSALESKGVKSLKDFLTATTPGSSRGDRPNMSVKKSARAAGFNEKRLALVIGNSNYDAMSYLRNAQSDAVDVSSTLQDLGFDVIESFETNYTDMKTALNRFASMGASYDVVLFYYAGHGVQEDGVNYLIPVDNPMEFKSNLKEALNADDVLGIMEACGAKNRMLFLDACRSPQIAWHRSAKAGLAKMEGSAGSVIMFSTESGNVASDGEEGSTNSPFATALMRNIVTNDPLSVVLSNVCNTTYQLTGEKQWPMQVGNLRGNFYFNPKGAAAQPIAQATSTRPSAPTASQSQRQPVATPIVKQPKMTMQSESVTPWVGSVKRVGSNCVITLYLTNNSNKTMYGLASNGEIYDDSGNLYKFDCQFGNGNVIVKSHHGFQFTLPGPSVAKIKLTLKDVPQDCNSIKYAKIAFRGIGTEAAYGEDELIIKNLPIGFNAPYTWRLQSPISVSFDAEDVDVKVSNARIVNNAAVFTVTLTNNTGKALSNACFMNGYGLDESTMVFDGDGNICRRDNGLTVTVAGSNGLDCKLPPEVPVKITVKCPDFDRSAGRIPLFVACFRNMPNDENYGRAKLVVHDIPIEN